MIWHRWIPLVAVLVLGLSADAWAGPPTEQLRTYTDQVLKILKDPTMALACSGCADSIFGHRFSRAEQNLLGRALSE